MFLATILLMIFSFGSNLSFYSDYIHWSPEYANRPDHMVCPDERCTPDPVTDAWTRDDCCVCKAMPEWEVPINKMQNVELEYIRRNGKAVILSDQQDANAFLHLRHDYGFLTKIPENICDYERLVKMELRSNQITEISNISCLSMLDTLDLNGNRIRTIGNDTFLGLTNLRVLNIAYNELIYLAPSTISGSSLQIFIADFSHNELEEMEFSNMISESDFCRFDFSSNKVTEIVNTNGFEIDPNKIYHGGMVDLNKNNFTSFIEFDKLGINDLSILGAVMSYGFVMTDMKWTCDCLMEPYLKHAGEIIKRIWRDYFNILCWNPPEMRGMSIPDLVKNDSLDLLICNLTAKDKCPLKCHCFDQPSENRTVVNCTGAGLRKLPNYVPDGNNLTLLFNDNDITAFENKTYFGRASVLDLSQNNINTLEEQALGSLKIDINLSLEQNAITRLPQEVQNFSPCQLYFGNITIICTCEDIWLRDWINNKPIDKCNRVNRIMCKSDNGLIPASKITKDILCKKEDSNEAMIIIGVLLGLVLLISSLIYYFRYEIFIIKRNQIFRKLSNKVVSRPQFDAFFSFNEDNDTLRMWTMEVLTRELEASGYKIFVPCRDLPIGMVQEEELLHKIVCSKHYIVLLCEHYLTAGKPWTGMEWKYIWHKFTEFLERNIILIDFDQLERKHLTDPKLKAFKRLGYFIDFSNRKQKLVHQIKEQLGPPLMCTHFNENRKPKFFLQKLVHNKYLYENNKDFKNEAKPKFLSEISVQNECLYEVNKEFHEIPKPKFLSEKLVRNRNPIVDDKSIILDEKGSLPGSVG